MILAVMFMSLSACSHYKSADAERYIKGEYPEARIIGLNIRTESQVSSTYILCNSDGKAMVVNLEKGTFSEEPKKASLVELADDKKDPLLCGKSVGELEQLRRTMESMRNLASSDWPVDRKYEGLLAILKQKK